MSELVILPFQNAFRRPTAQAFVSLIDRCQQLNISSRVAWRKTVPAVAGFSPLPVFAESFDEPVHVHTTQARRVDQVRSPFLELQYHLVLETTAYLSIICTGKDYNWQISRDCVL